MKTYRGKWYEFTPDWSGFSLKYAVAGYFDNRPHLQIYFIWGKLFVYLPWKHYKLVEDEFTLKEKRKNKLENLKGNKIKKKYKKEYYDECEPPLYGIYFFMQQFGINFGRKTKLYDLPWTLDWVRTSVLKKDGEWENEYPKNKKNFWDDNKWKDILYYEKHPYRYITKSGEIQDCEATIKVEEREWRWKWFKWLKWTRKISKSIEVDFSAGIGENKNSWKGGCTGCSYEFLPDETPTDCLKRMERERKFR